MLPHSEIRAILNHVTGRYCRLEDCSKEERIFVDAIIRKRLTGMPLAKILGFKEFWKHRFITTEDTLDPRPDSETLIEAVLKTCPQKPYKILDLGTGTGCLLISLLTEYPEAIGTGVDISEKTLGVARRNSHILQSGHPRTGEDDMRTCISWVQSNWCEKLTGTFDIIVSNPPYIDSSEIINEGATFDPPLALYGGIHTYEIILKSIDAYLTNRPSYIFFEVGSTQAEDVSLLLKNFGYLKIKTYQDLSGHTRIVSACIY